MSHLTVYVKRSKGQLQYRDSEGNTGDTITSHAKHDEKIIWKLDKCSGISEITGIQLKGDLDILNGTPANWTSTNGKCTPPAKPKAN